MTAEGVITPMSKAGRTSASLQRAAPKCLKATSPWIGRSPTGKNIPSMTSASLKKSSSASSVPRASSSRWRSVFLCSS